MKSCIPMILHVTSVSVYTSISYIIACSCLSDNPPYLLTYMYVSSYHIICSFKRTNATCFPPNFFPSCACNFIFLWGINTVNIAWRCWFKFTMNFAIQKWVFCGGCMFNNTDGLVQICNPWMLRLLVFNIISGVLLRYLYW